MSRERERERERGGKRFHKAKKINLGRVGDSILCAEGMLRGEKGEAKKNGRKNKDEDEKS